MTTSPSGFLQIGADLAEKDIGRDADRAGEAFADLLAQGPLDLHRQLTRDRDLALGAHQPAGLLVDRHDLVDRQAGVDRLQNALVILAIEPVIGPHRDDGGAQAPRLADDRAGLDAECLGRVAGGNRDGAVGRRLHDDDGLAAQGRGLLLLARRKEGIEVKEQPLDGRLGIVHCLFYTMRKWNLQAIPDRRATRSASRICALSTCRARAAVPAGTQAIIPHAAVQGGRPNYMRLIDIERRLRCQKCGARGKASLEVEFRPRD